LLLDSPYSAKILHSPHPKEAGTHPAAGPRTGSPPGVGGMEDLSLRWVMSSMECQLLECW